MTDIALAVVGHPARRDMAFALTQQVDADVLMMDTGGFGCEGNHRRAWDWHTEHTGTGWAVVLEDDAMPVDGFADQLTAALAAAPAPIVSLYLGTSRPPRWQPRIRQAITRADAEAAHYITSTSLLHAVAVAIHTDHLPMDLDWKRLPIDQAIGNWAKSRNRRIAYTWPSLVNHNDGPTLVAHPDHAPRDKPRTAWRTGSRHQWNSRTTVQM